MSKTPTAALVGATGGAGTTRLTVEAAAALARADHDVAVLDAAFATQGLAAHVEGRIDPDVTALLTDAEDAPLADGLVDLALDGPGRVACCPSAAPFERLSRAKTAGAARRFEERIAEAAERFDAVLVDVPPVASNQAVAAVNATGRTGLVAPATTRGADATQRMRGRLADLGATVDAVFSTRGELPVADVAVPASSSTAAADSPVDPGADELAAVAAAAAGVLLDVQVDTPVANEGLLGSISDYV